jgi:hypothetical protein
MARKRLRQGDVKWVAYPDGPERVEIVERGIGGRAFRGGVKPENPYVVNGDDGEYVLSEADLFDNPVQASIASAKMRAEHGLADNPLDEDEDDEDEYDDNPLEDDEDEDFDDENEDFEDEED